VSFREVILRQTISDHTGFDAGEKFKTEAEVRDYFTAVEQRHMFVDDAVTDQTLLSLWADVVIGHGWHCEFSTTR
jgi:hypothetical protein